MANVQASVEAQIFGANVMAMLSREETTEDVEGEDKVREKITSKFLVMPSELTENMPFGVEDIVKEINETIYKIENNVKTIEDKKGVPSYVDAKDVQNAMDVVGLGNATLTFTQTFIYYTKVKQTLKDKNSTTNNGESEDSTESEDNSNMEYAIGIHIKGSDPKPKDFSFLTIREAYINVWNTNRQKVLERMKIWTEEQLGIE